MGFGIASFSGLASGIDWQQMLDQIMLIERRRVDQVVNRKSELESKLEAFKALSDLLDSLDGVTNALRASSAFDLFRAELSSSSSKDAEDLLGISASSTASKSTYDIVISQIATSRKLSSTSFSDTTSALSLSGEIVINGKALAVSATDDLLDIRDAINALDAGVTASIISVSSTDNRLVLTSEDTGEGKLSLLDASTSDLLQSLGFTDSTTSVKNSLSNGAATDKFTSRTTAIGSILGLSSAPSGTVQINGTNVTLDLSTQSLDDIKTAIDAAGITGVTTSITTSTENGTTKYRLEMSGATSFSDSNNVLEALGVLEGGTADVAAVLTGSVQNTSTLGGAITASTTFAQISGANVQDGDTITITGKDHNGTSVSSTFTISNAATTTVQDFLTAIESAFSNTVTASVDANGAIQITDNTAGDSQLELSLSENNEGGGSLDFGTFSASTVGRKREVQSGQDAQLTIDGVSIERSSNQIDDVITGVTLNVKSADANTTITVDIDRDIDSIKAKIEEFVDAYNAVSEFIGQQFKYDEEEGGAQGVLFGDGTLRSVKTDLSSLIIQQVNGVSSSYNTLALIGITLDNEGILSIDQSKLEGLLKTNFSDVRAVLAGIGTTSSGTLDYVSHSRDTEPGTYTVNITQAASQASVTGTADLNDADGLDGSETLTLTDTLTGRVATISLTAGSKIDTIVAAINEALEKEYAQVYTGSTANTKTSGAGGGAISALTVWEQINTGGDSNNISDGDTITFSGTKRNGGQVSGTYTISDKSTDTVQGLLTAIETAFGNEVLASIDTTGKLVVTDKTVGDSKLSITVTANNEGGGSLDFGTFSETTSGRYAMEIIASDDGNGRLKLTHNNYGTAYGFTVSQSANNLGITDGSFAGVDVAGTINSETATGSGQVLTGDSDASNVAGLAVRYTGTSTGNVGTVTFTEGIMESFNRTLYQVLDKFDGYVPFKQTSLEDTIKRFESQIEREEQRLERKRLTLLSQFVAMENTISRLQSVSNWLNSTLAGLNG